MEDNKELEANEEKIPHDCPCRVTIDYPYVVGDDDYMEFTPESHIIEERERWDELSRVEQDKLIEEVRLEYLFERVGAWVTLGDDGEYD